MITFFFISDTLRFWVNVVVFQAMEKDFSGFQFDKNNFSRDRVGSTDETDVSGSRRILCDQYKTTFC